MDLDLDPDRAARSVRQAQIMNLRLARDGYAQDEYSEARVCDEPGCRVVHMAHGKDERTGERNRASERCTSH